MGASLHQAQFAYLREGAVATRSVPPKAAALAGESGTFGPCRLEPSAANPGRRLPASAAWPAGGPTARTTAHGSQSQTLTSDTETGAVRRPFAGLQASVILEDLTNGQVGEDAHGQDDPEDDFTLKQQQRVS